MSGEVRRIGAEDRTEAAMTPGMVREEAVATDRMWGGVARTEPGSASGWHHHGKYETTFYVLSGAVRVEFGRGGGDTVDLGPGDFGYIARDTVHRESDPSGEEAVVVVVRAGSGPAVINVEGPDPT